MKIGFIGLGQMGRGMAARLLDQGHELTVWNRTPSAAEALQARGATVARDREEAVNAEVAGSGVTVTAVCPGPVPTEFQAANDAQELADKLPGFTHVSAERVVADALKAAEHGRGSVVPGGPQVRLALGSTRFVPTPLVLPVLKRMLKR